MDRMQPDATPTTRTGLPVAVNWAGPVGLAAAAHLLDRGLEPVVLEAGSGVGASIAEWRHVRLFSPWRFNLDPASVRLLTVAGWQRPDPDELPTGGDLVDRYLRPLAALPILAVTCACGIGAQVQLELPVSGVCSSNVTFDPSPTRSDVPAAACG